MRFKIQNLILAGGFAASAIFAGCGNGVAGVYSDPNGAVTLELKSGGVAALTFMNETATCSYAVSGQQINLDCKGDPGKLSFTIHDDGSLTGPPGSFMPSLRKRK